MEWESALSLPEAGLRDRLARSFLFRLLGGLQQACLVLQEGDDQFRFGDTAATLQAHVVVRDPALYGRLLQGGSIAAAESYVAGMWHTTELTSLVRILARNQVVLDKLEQALGWLTLPLQRWQHRNNCV